MYQVDGRSMYDGAMDATQLLDLLLFGPYIEIVKALLPDRRGGRMGAGPFFITKNCAGHHRRLTARRRQWDRPVVQG